MKVNWVLNDTMSVDDKGMQRIPSVTVVRVKLTCHVKAGFPIQRPFMTWRGCKRQGLFLYLKSEWLTVLDPFWSHLQLLVVNGWISFGRIMCLCDDDDGLNRKQNNFDDSYTLHNSLFFRILSMCKRIDTCTFLKEDLSRQLNSLERQWSAFTKQRKSC